MYTKDGQKLFVVPKDSKSKRQKLNELAWQVQRHFEQLYLISLGHDIKLSIPEQAFEQLLLRRQKLRNEI